MILNTDEIHEYILVKEKGKPDATVFLIKEITCGVTNLVSDEATTRDKNGKFRVLMGKSNEIIITHCLVGWRNLKNKKGEDIPFSIETIFSLPPSIQTEINDEINRISKLTDLEIKN